MANREKQILHLLRRDPFIQQQEIADILGISRSCVAGHIMNLSKKGHIKGKGYILSDNRYAVTVGAANMDVTSYAFAELIYEDSNPGKIQSTAGGVGRNIAHNIALLGSESYLISVIGNDFYGKTLFEQTKLAGVYVDYFHKLYGETTSTYNSVIDDSGEMRLAINDMNILEKLTPALLSQSKALIQNAGVLIIDCNLTEESLEWLFSHAGNIPIFVDTVSTFKATKIRHWLSHIHTLKPNRFEAERLSGIKIVTLADAADTATWFHQQGVQRLALSMGTAGVYYSEIAGIAGCSPAIPINIVNANGAGDAMMAGLARCWLEGMTLEDSIRFAQGCSALTLSSELTNHPNLSSGRVKKLLELKS
ncbi:putative sugar kinase with ribokinase-like domain [Xenorhabdus bovienii str. kraussei Quebec]|uniref:Putative sugar kinase with ribokinase-like domain n=1 Tax=Xenorhabdus bovienii str. kraussei Quebec TaxID=1398203 RepID=A0A077PEW5_XENBV|nr:PfkB family carbohydrate kinase [Xenorhabdus bovienii]CDH19226.1 putative sugar kinase with ribokinase-like domain [Xenorhabdus bovienii str. kraussei Quebec]